MSASSVIEPIGVIGVGRIGSAVIGCLHRAGWPVSAYDVRPDALADAPELDALAPSPAAVAREASIVLVAVLDEDQLRAVLSGPDGLLAPRRDGLAVCVLSTVSLPAIHESARAAEAAGATLLDCGVTGGGSARDGQLVTMLGGDEGAVGRVRPALETFSKLVVHAGPLGSGMQMKLARNVVIYGAWLAAHEAARLTDRLGLDRAQFVEVLRESNPNVGPVWTWLAEPSTASAAPPGEATARQAAAASLMRKDLGAAERLGAAHGLDMPIARLGGAAAEQVVGIEPDAGDPDGDTALRSSAMSDAEQRVEGAATMARVYGFSVDDERYDASLLARYTLHHLFADIWSRSALSIRDRRLMTMGAVAALGRGELWELQLRAAFANGEVTLAQMQEMVLHMAHYIGWPRTIAIEQAVHRLLAELAPRADDGGDPPPG